MAINNQIKTINEAGQSIWYDNLSRDVLRSGKLKELIEQGVSGLTSNPSIFEQAISGSSEYDSDFNELKDKNLNTEELCEELMINDVAKAADLLIDTYNKTNGDDGYASLEVSPFLADDTEGTVEAAKRLWSKLNRPNIMIKIPATEAGIPAIEEVLTLGINVNVTLIFSVKSYLDVVKAYLNALENRIKNNQPIDKIASVASFFVSRVDAISEKKLSELVDNGKIDSEKFNQFLGKVGIANSRLAYAEFEKNFSNSFDQLKSKKAKVQRPLWASTSTKNPDFNELLYVESLAGADTVNTLPPKTLEALINSDSIKGNLKEDFEKAPTLISELNELIPFEELLIQLQEAGVNSFAESYKNLLVSIEEKVKSI
ncbi:UNVERIFIED_CONTAM: hypothetical protein GTU68_001706 [Idotea baltica]|nr:hypothetical protein [Idotea baltica]